MIFTLVSGYTPEVASHLMRHPPPVRLLEYPIPTRLYWDEIWVIRWVALSKNGDFFPWKSGGVAMKQGDEW